MTSKSNETQIGGTHYKETKIQPWDAIQDWGLGFLDGNVIKYIARWRKKNGLEDLLKARHYLDKLIERQNELAGIKSEAFNSVPMATEDHEAFKRMFAKELKAIYG